jgi:hypothetical protein
MPQSSQSPALTYSVDVTPQMQFAADLLRSGRPATLQDLVRLGFAPQQAQLYAGKPLAQIQSMQKMINTPGQGQAAPQQHPTGPQTPQEKQGILDKMMKYLEGIASDPNQKARTGTKTGDPYNRDPNVSVKQ